MRKSTYIKVGAFVVTGAFLAIAACIILGAKSFRRQVTFFETYIEGGVHGIGNGSAVSYRGVRIGQVESVSVCWIAYRGKFPETAEGWRAARYARIVFSVDDSFLGSGDFTPEGLEEEVRDGMRISMKAQGITGINTLDLDFYEKPPAPLPIPWDPEYTYIPSAPSFTKSVADAVRDASKSLSGLGVLASNVNELVESSTATIGEGRLSVMGVIDNVERASKSLADAIEQIRADPSVLFRRPREQEDPE